MRELGAIGLDERALPRGGATQTPVPIRRGNLLAMRQIATSGNARTWRYRYRRPSNKVSAIVGPRGVDVANGDRNVVENEHVSSQR